MKCIILAAGASTRIRPVSNDLPKCLVPVGGKPILQRIMENVLAAGIQGIGIVLGYMSDDVRAFVRKQFPHQRIKFAVNPKFAETNNAFSLLMARGFYFAEANKAAGSQPLLLLDSDIVFSPQLLPFFLKGVTSDGLAVRVQGDHNEEEIRVKIDGQNNVLQIGKQVPLAQTYGESIGIEVFSSVTAEKVFETLEHRVKNGPGRTEFYEASFQHLIDGGLKIKAVDVSDFPAAEIDTPDDLAFVEKKILPKIDQSPAA